MARFELSEIGRLELADLPRSLGGFAEGQIDGRAVLKLIVKCA